MFKILREMLIKTTLRFHLKQVRMAKKKKKKKNQNKQTKKKPQVKADAGGEVAK
jgi:hypothetical protein